MNINLKVAIGVIGSLLVVSCGPQAYAPPKEKQPFALVKLKYSYSSVVKGTSLGARAMIRHGGPKSDWMVAHRKSYGVVRKGSARQKIPIESIKVHVGKPTDVQMAVYFFWYTTQTYTTYINNIPQIQTRQVYHERTCKVDVNFTPQQGKVYLIDYNNPNVTKGCNGKAYQQIKRANGKFKLKPVGTSKIAVK